MPAAAPPAARTAPAALPPRLSPERLRALAARASYRPGGAPRETLRVVAPFTGEDVLALPAADAADMAHAFAVARRAQQAWAATPFPQRAAVFARLHDLVLEAHEEGLDLVQLESGKARIHALEEVMDVALVARYYAYHGQAALERSARRGALPLLTRVEVNYLPVGVVGIIAPWNYPLSMGITDAIPALLAGNAVVVKPAEQTPLTALWTAELLAKAGLPAGLLHFVPGDGAALGPPLIAHADYLHFTGSTETGRLVAQQAAERLIGCSLELGGKNPLIVLDDADLDQTVEGALRACFSSAGQLCISAERLYVQRPLYDAFLERFARRAEALRVGPGYRYDVDMGALVSREHLEKVRRHVEDAVGKGARVWAGGVPLPEAGPLFFAPTVLTDVTDEMTLFREETFGPVVAVYPFDTDDEAVACANDSVYGLNASVWSGNATRARAVARRLRCGTVNINEGYASAWASTDAPMGGFGASGVGRRHGPEGIRKYAEAQTVAEQRGLPMGPLPGMALEAFAGMALTGLRVLRRLPGLR
ncbi:MAG: succinic semialdehyde dehydrogenase [Rubricoccaceae bacterium]